MTDYAGEQAMELEALEAILMDDLQEFDGNLPPNWTKHAPTYIISIRPTDEEGGEEDAQPELEMELLFAHTPTYPDEAPCIRLRSVTGVSDADIAAATKVLQQQIEQDKGMAMIYNLVTAAQEWLTARAAAAPGASGAVDEEAEAKRLRDAEEAARTAARAHGTPVTVESFNAWKRQFDAAQALAKAAITEADKEADAKAARLTGRAWFVRQAAEGAQSEGGDEGALSSETEVDEAALLEDDSEVLPAEEEEDEEEDLDYEDDDDDGMLEEYLAGKN